MASMEVQKGLFQPQEITLVDDVLTQGRTAVACAQLLQSALPNALIRVFAVFRTQGFVAQINKIMDPSTGRVIGYPSGKAYRDP